MNTRTRQICSPTVKAQLKKEGLYDEGAINIYYVSSYYAATDERWVGLTCLADPSIIVIGEGASFFTPAHEIGHALSLDHVTAREVLGTRNVMDDAALYVKSASLGQIYRANLNPSSFLNLSGIRKGPTRFCPDNAASRSCPHDRCTRSNPQCGS